MSQCSPDRIILHNLPCCLFLYSKSLLIKLWDIIYAKYFDKIIHEKKNDTYQIVIELSRLINKVLTFNNHLKRE